MKLVDRRYRFGISCLRMLGLLAAVLPACDLARGNTVITVPAGGNLQQALWNARPGDTIVLAAGATYRGPFALPNKTGTDWITVQSSALDKLPEPGQRVGPGDAAAMPRLVDPGTGEAALLTEPGAHHYRFVGIEFATAGTGRVYELVNLGDGSSSQNSLDRVPHHLVLDRCYIHGSPTGILRRGVSLQSADTDILGCHIADVHEQMGFDSQAIAGWNGPGRYRILNNYLEGAGENIMFGGADPSIVNLVPSDIEIRRNHITKPLSWRGSGWQIKNLLELKFAQRVLIDGNLFENNWAAAQTGFAILFTPLQDGGAPWATVQDVTFTNNIVRHSGSGINMSGQDRGNDSQQGGRFRIANNLFEDINGSRWGGDGRLFQILNGAKDVTIEHNTCFPESALIMSEGGPFPGFVYRNNIMPHAGGVVGSGTGYGFPTLSNFPGYVFVRNVLAAAETVGADPSRYPANNFFPLTLEAVGFVDLAGGNYRLRPDSPYKGKGTDGADPGCNFAALEAAMAAPKAPAETQSAADAQSPDPSAAP